MKVVLGLFLIAFFVFETYNLIVSIKNAREQKRIKKEKEQKDSQSKVSQEHVGNSKDKK